MRYATVDRIIEHVARLKEQYGLSVLTIYDDQILKNRARAKELFAKLAGLDIRVEMPNGVTLSYIDEELVGLMKNAGVDTIFLAIEHGSKRGLKDIIRKPISFGRIKPTIQMLQSSGIFTCAFLVARRNTH
jgi:anaerobic magnesium-protoporphyrin IX monomethyl ester cyclase